MTSNHKGKGRRQKAIISFIRDHPGCKLRDLLMCTTPYRKKRAYTVGGPHYNAYTEHTQRINGLVKQGLILQDGIYYSLPKDKT